MHLNSVMKNLDEQQLLNKVLNGDTEAYAPLVERYSRPIFTLVMGIVQHREEAEELTQDIFVKAYTALGSFSSRSSFSTWLYRIACNTALSAVRHKRHRFALFDASRVERLVDISDEESLDVALNEEQERRLLVALKLLSAEERTLVHLHYYEGKSCAKCGEILGLTENNVKVRLHRIRKKLEICINEMD